MRDICSIHIVQEIRTSETYLAIFNSMDTVVFFNGRGREVQLWKELAGATLPSRNIEGRPQIALSVQGAHCGLTQDVHICMMACLEKLLVFMKRAISMAPVIEYGPRSVSCAHGHQQCPTFVARCMLTCLRTSLGCRRVISTPSVPWMASHTMYIMMQNS